MKYVANTILIIVAIVAMFATAHNLYLFFKQTEFLKRKWNALKTGFLDFLLY